MTLLHETGSHIRWKEVRELVVGEWGRQGLPQERTKPWDLTTVLSCVGVWLGHEVFLWFNP